MQGVTWSEGDEKTFIDGTGNPILNMRQMMYLYFFS